MKKILALLFLSIIGFSDIQAQNNSIFSDGEYSQEITISPNPATDFIKITGLETDQNFVIYDMVGQVVKTGVLRKNDEIAIYDFENGLYILKFDDKTILKFIKK